MQFVYLFMIALAAIIIVAAVNSRKQRGGASAYDPFKNRSDTDENSFNAAGKYTRLSAGKYIIDEDVAPGKYDFILISGEGVLKYREDGQDEYSTEIEFGFAKASQATRYRNLLCTPRGELLLVGSAVLEIRNSTKTVVN